jgi:hypothetical protein
LAGSAQPSAATLLAQRPATLENTVQELELVKVTLRLPAPLHAALADAAHSARLPLAVYLRELLSGSTPPPAPPALTAAAIELMAILSRLASNLTQLHGHCLRTGQPLAQLAVDGGFLHCLRRDRDRLADQLDAGQMGDPAVKSLLAALHAPGRAVNDLAARLNQDAPVPPADWRPPLAGLRAALDSCMENK